MDSRLHLPLASIILPRCGVASLHQMAKKQTSPSDLNPSQATPTPSSSGSRRRTAKMPSEASDRSPATLTQSTTSEEVLAAASEVVPAAGESMMAQPSYDQIAEAAYQRYLSRGGADGHDLDDWIEAERQLRERGR
jgi:hypothetical protein